MSSTRVRLGTTCGWGARNWRTLVTPKRHEQIRVHVTNGWGNRVYHWWPSYESYVLTGEHVLFSFDSCHGDSCTHFYFWCSCSSSKLWQAAKVVLRFSGLRCFCPICGCFRVVWMHGNRGMPKHQTPTTGRRFDRRTFEGPRGLPYGLWFYSSRYETNLEASESEPELGNRPTEHLVARAPSMRLQHCKGKFLNVSETCFSIKWPELFCLVASP